MWDFDSNCKIFGSVLKHEGLLKDNSAQALIPILDPINTLIPQYLSNIITQNIYWIKYPKISNSTNNNQKLYDKHPFNLNQPNHIYWLFLSSTFQTILLILLMNEHEEPLSISRNPELIQKKFTQMLSKKSLHALDDNANKKPRFDARDLQKIRKDFQVICPSQKMEFQEFRASLGLFGSEDFFIRRLFNLLDQDNDGLVTVKDYHWYLDVIFNGSQFERANFGWRLLTGSRSYIQLKDLHQLFYEITMMWNAITGEVVTPKRQYIQQIFQLFDLDHDETITLEDYIIFFSQQYLIFGWFQFLNNFPMEDSILKIGFKQKRASLEMKRKATIQKHRNSTRQQEKIIRNHKQELLKKKFKDLCQQLTKVAKLTKQEQKQKVQTSPFLDLSQKTDHSFLSRANQPVILLRMETIQDKQDTAQYIDLLPQSKRYLMKARVDLPDKDTSGKVMNQLKLCLDKVNILQEVCRQLKNQQNKQKIILKNKKGLQIMLGMVNKKMSCEQPDEEQQVPHKNLAVYFGHQNWNLVLNLMVGMRQSIKTLHDLGSDIKSSHFKQKQSFVLSSKVQQFRSGQQYYKFEDYAPSVFEKLREAVGITNKSYQYSVGPEILMGKLAMGDLTAINEKFSTGKSGSFFYQTHDGKYLLKTISKNECQFFISILKSYYQHMVSNPHTLIVRMFGLYKLKKFRNKTKIATIRFIAMQNIFHGGLKTIAKYDLKGSSYDRRGSQHQFKDNDWNDHKQRIELPKLQREIFKSQVSKDVAFLRSNNINDYSMLFGIFELPNNKQVVNLFPNNKSLFRQVQGGCENLRGDKVYIMSIIDVLTQFGFKKQMEFISKRVFLGEGVSCIPPQQYSQRFVQFITKAVYEEDEQM